MKIIIMKKTTYFCATFYRKQQFFSNSQKSLLVGDKSIGLFQMYPVIWWLVLVLGNNLPIICWKYNELTNVKLLLNDTTVKNIWRKNRI